LQTLTAVLDSLFPKPNEKSAVTHVQVTWNQLHFRYKLQQLEAQGVKQALVHAVGSNREFLASVHPQEVGIHLHYLMRLTGIELQQLDNFGEHKVQVHSHSPVIVKGHEKIYKYCDIRWLGKYMLLKKVQPMPQQTLLPENDIQVHGLTFFVYPLLSHPLTREEAYECLGHLLERNCTKNLKLRTLTFVWRTSVSRRVMESSVPY